MRNLNYEVKQLCHRNRDGSFATQADRERILDLIANQLHELGYLADPHSAVAYRVLRDRVRAGEAGVFLATADPAKFADVIERSLGVSVPLPPALAEAQALPLRSEPFAGDAAALKARLQAHHS